MNGGKKMNFMHIKHVVFVTYYNLRWFFIDTENPNKYYYISLNPLDLRQGIKDLIRDGVNILIPPFKKEHIKGNW